MLVENFISLRVAITLHAREKFFFCFDVAQHHILPPRHRNKLKINGWWTEGDFFHYVVAAIKIASQREWLHFKAPHIFNKEGEEGCHLLHYY